MEKIRKGDRVIVLSGRDKGKKGEVFQVMPKEAPGARARRQHRAPASAPDARSRKAGSSPRRRRSTCPTWRWRIPRTASRRGWASRFWPTGARCASPSAPASRFRRPDSHGRRRRQARKAAQSGQGRWRREAGQGSQAPSRASPTRAAPKRRPRVRQPGKGKARDGKGAPKGEKARSAGRSSAKGLSPAHEDALREGGARGDEEAVRLRRTSCRSRASTRSSSTWAWARRSTIARRSMRPPRT